MLLKKLFAGLLLVGMMLNVLCLFGCSGGSAGGNSSNNSAAQVVKGVAATGSPLAGSVYLKDSSSPVHELSATISADGSFSFDVTGLTAPFLLKAVGTSNSQSYTLYSFTGAPGVANINPLADLAVRQANGGADPALLYAATTGSELLAIKAALVAAIPEIQALLQPILSQYGVTHTNFISGSYVANHTGLDLLFDLIAIDISNGNLTIVNRLTGANILTTALTGNPMSGQITTVNVPTIATQSTGTVYVWPATSSVAPGASVNFRAIVIGATDQSVTWSLTEAGGGSVTGSGVYTAPATAGTYHITATSVVDTTKTGTATITVSSSTAATAPFVQAYVFSQAGSSSPFFALQSVAVFTDNTCSTPITDATVIINGTPLVYSSTYQEYLGNTNIVPGASVNLSVTVGGNTYTASGTQYSTFPTINSPTSGATWLSTSTNTVSWTSGSSTTGATYFVGVIDPDGGKFYYSAGSLPMTTNSYVIAANALTANSPRTETYPLIVGIGTAGIADKGTTGGIAIPNAAAGSGLWVGLMSQPVPISLVVPAT